MASSRARTGVVAAGQDPGLLHAVQTAFTHGMDVSLLVAAAIAGAGAILALFLLPGRRPDAPVEGERLVLAESSL